jgi:hypothetical protein
MNHWSDSRRHLLPSSFLLALILRSLRCLHIAHGQTGDWSRYDFLIDADMQTWLLEINCSPTFEHSTPITTRLIRELSEDVIKVTIDLPLRRDANLRSRTFQKSSSIPPAVRPAGFHPGGGDGTAGTRHIGRLQDHELLFGRGGGNATLAYKHSIQGIDTGKFACIFRDAIKVPIGPSAVVSMERFSLVGVAMKVLPPLPRAPIQRPLFLCPPDRCAISQASTVAPPAREFSLSRSQQAKLPALVPADTHAPTASGTGIAAKGEKHAPTRPGKSGALPSSASMRDGKTQGLEATTSLPASLASSQWRPPPGTVAARSFNLEPVPLPRFFCEHLPQAGSVVVCGAKSDDNSPRISAAVKNYSEQIVQAAQEGRGVRGAYVWPPENGPGQGIKSAQSDGSHGGQVEARRRGFKGRGSLQCQLSMSRSAAAAARGGDCGRAQASVPRVLSVRHGLSDAELIGNILAQVEGLVDGMGSEGKLGKRVRVHVHGRVGVGDVLAPVRNCSPPPSSDASGCMLRGSQSVIRDQRASMEGTCKSDDLGTAAGHTGSSAPCSPPGPPRNGQNEASSEPAQQHGILTTMRSQGHSHRRVVAAAKSSSGAPQARRVNIECVSLAAMRAMATLPGRISTLPEDRSSGVGAVGKLLTHNHLCTVTEKRPSWQQTARHCRHALQSRHLTQPGVPSLSAMAGPSTPPAEATVDAALEQGLTPGAGVDTFAAAGADTGTLLWHAVQQGVVQAGKQPGA